MSKITLNLGCGEKIFSEYPEGYSCINVDSRLSLSKIDVISDVRSLPFEDNFADYVLASDIIEHFPLIETEVLLKEWRRVLKPEGIIEIKTPNLDFIVNHYVKNKDAKFASYHLFGGQTYPENFHYVVFNTEWLKQICNNAGFKSYDTFTVGSNFVLKARKSCQT